MAVIDIYNYKYVSDQHITAGQPTEEQLRSAGAEGFDAVVNLATFNPEESLEGEQEIVESLSMSYVHIPVKWNRPIQSDLSRFFDALKALDGKKVLIHCIANFRATAFFSLFAEKHMGWSDKQGDAFIRAIWNPEEYPVWRKFIDEMRNTIGDL